MTAAGGPRRKRRGPAPAVTSGELSQALCAGLGRLEVAGGAALAERLAEYLLLLERWNRVTNLTAVRDPRDMVPRHVLDSLSILPWVQGPRLVDVGSGAGLPGIPLAMADPGLEVTLLDVRERRTRFLRHAATVLGLQNVHVVTARAEQYRPPRKSDTLASRAFASIPELVDAAGHLCRTGGRILAQKAEVPGTELAAVAARGMFEVVEIVPLQVPGLQAVRHVVVLERRG